MVRVPALRRAGAASRRLAEVRDRVERIVRGQAACLRTRVLPRLAEAGVGLLERDAYPLGTLEQLRGHFRNGIYPALTPVRITPEESVPLPSLRLHVGFLLEPADEQARSASAAATAGEGPVVAVVPLPGALDRLVPVPQEESGVTFALLEDLVAANADLLFPGFRILDSLLFRVTRSGDAEVDELRDDDFVEAMEEVISARRGGVAVRMEVSDADCELCRLLAAELSVEPADIYACDGPLDLAGWASLVDMPGLDRLRFEPWEPVRPTWLDGTEPIWSVIQTRDRMLHHPYESFDAVVHLLEQAADDPEVLAIKMTLYRVSRESPIVAALGRAAEAGKQVTVLVEVKARFDEERNLERAALLERQGAIVVYGIAWHKVHAKALLIVRREHDRIRRYVHLGTGNYRDDTARLYTDVGLLTTDDELAMEVGLFFNAITGYSTVPNMRRLAMAPTSLKQRLLAMIEREAARGANEQPLIMAKLNQLTDGEVIDALYAASRAGVTIKLNVRGECLLIPERRGMSRNITVVSVIDRYLEHARLLYVRAGGADECYLASADWMPRNLSRRVELMVPISEPGLKRRTLAILQSAFADNTSAYRLRSDGTYVRVRRASADEPFYRSQEAMHEAAARRARTELGEPAGKLIARRPRPER
jgi:polyphosphate kinase